MSRVSQVSHVSHVSQVSQVSHVSQMSLKKMNDWKGFIFRDDRIFQLYDKFHWIESTLGIILFLLLSYAIHRGILLFLSLFLRRFTGVQLTGAVTILWLIWIAYMWLGLELHWAFCLAYFGYWFVKVFFNLGADELWTRSV